RAVALQKVELQKVELQRVALQNAARHKAARQKVRRWTGARWMAPHEGAVENCPQLFDSSARGCDVAIPCGVRERPVDSLAVSSAACPGRGPDDREHPR